MHSTTTVSVIIPVYNAEHRLRECLDSVCTQTLSNYEVLCIDDCSTDCSLEILREYMELFSFVRVLSMPQNSGAGPARNVGLKEASGEYVAFMDADDRYPNQHALKMLYCAAKHKNALICGGSVLFDTNGHISEGKCGAQDFCFHASGWISYHDYQQYYYYQRFIFDRKLLKENQITFPHYLRFQDPPFFVKAMACAKRFYAIKNAVYVYNNDASHVNWTTHKVNDMLCGMLDVFRLCSEYHLDKLYIALLQRCVKSRYFMDILENSLINGNNDVLHFYRTIIDELDEGLLANAKNLDLTYAHILAKATLTRNMQNNYDKALSHLSNIYEKPQPLVSVIIPVYNAEPYLGLCIDSIVGQTLTDIEIVCIDDGATDESAKILAEYAHRYQNVHVYHQENKGLSAARNAGLKHAIGRYVYFMDSDDFLVRTALEDLYTLAEKDRLDIIYFSAKSFFENTEEAYDPKNKYFLNAYRRKDVYPQVLSGKRMFVAQLHNQDYYTSVPLQFFRRAFLIDNSQFFYEGLLHEDNLFTLCAIILAQRVKSIPDVYFYRRVRTNSIMTQKLSYRNLLGYYLTAVEASKLLNDTDLQPDERSSLYARLQTLIQSHVCCKWLALHAADRVLFLASLTPSDRLIFQTMCIPVINMLEKVKKAPNDSARLQNLQRELNKLKQETVSKNSKSYRIGRAVTFIPRKLRGGILCYKQHGMKYTFNRLLFHLRIKKKSSCF